MINPAKFDLQAALKRWIRRMRFQRAVGGLFSGLLSGLIVCSILALYIIFYNQLLENEFVLLAAAVIGVSTSIGGLVGFAWPINKMNAARKFDQLFGTKERVSTALELQEQPRANRLAAQQAGNAAEVANQVNYKALMPLKIPTAIAIAAIALIISNAIFLFYSDEVFLRAQQKRQIQSAIADQASEIETLIEEIRENPDLSEDVKTDLIAPLQESLEKLNASESLEEAFSALEEAQEQLKALENPDIESLAEALREAGDELSGEDTGGMESFTESLAEGNFADAAEEINTMNLENLTESDLQAAAEQLEQLANAAEANNAPDLAETLRAAAKDAAAGDTQAALEHLEQTAEALANLEQQIAASEAAERASNQLEQNQEQIINAGQQGAGEQQAATGGSAGTQGDSGNEPGGSGAGDGTGNGEAQPGQETGNSPIEQSNNPDGFGESTFQPISPSSIGGVGGDWVAIPPSGEEGDNITGVGPADPGSTSPITVPYTEVLPAYQNTANQAIDSGEIPPQYRDLIRDYFSSLEP